MSFKAALKQRATWMAGRLLGRTLVLLPREAGAEDLMLTVDAPYRVEDLRLDLRISEAAAGHLTATLWGYVGHFPTVKLWQSPALSYDGPCVFSHDLRAGELRLGRTVCGSLPAIPGRRFCWEWQLDGTGCRRSRMTGHYVGGDVGAHDAGYYSGNNYVDYEAESADEHQQVLALMRAHGAQSPVLDIGCATGGLMQALLRASYESMGVDVSEWAIARARERVGNERAAVCDFEKDPLPPGLGNAAPFRTFVLWAMLEHCRNPFALLRKLTAIAPPSATLILNTTNSDSLSHRLFGRDWEGYFDATHYGVEGLSVGWLRKVLPEEGWEIRELRTSRVWDSSPDPDHATFREWWASDARFRRFLVESDLGDFITCVAVRC
jgi:SAM-dependent methyltransferase